MDNIQNSAEIVTQDKDRQLHTPESFKKLAGLPTSIRSIKIRLKCCQFGLKNLQPLIIHAI